MSDEKPLREPNHRVWISVTSLLLTVVGGVIFWRIYFFPTVGVIVGIIALWREPRGRVVAWIGVTIGLIYLVPLALLVLALSTYGG